MLRPVSRALRIPKCPLVPSRAFTSLTSRPLICSSHARTTTNPIQARANPNPVLRCGFYASPIRQQGSSASPSPASRPPNPHTDFYKTHGRALFKALTLAFFTYQVCYWAWLVLETEEAKDQKSREIKSLEGEVRLLDEGRMSHLSKR